MNLKEMLRKLHDYYRAISKGLGGFLCFAQWAETFFETILERPFGMLEACSQIQSLQGVSTMTDSLCSAVSIETLAPMRVACYRAASLSPEEDGAKYMLEWWRRQGGGAPGRHFGFDVDVSPEQQKEGLRGYEIWLCVPEGFAPSGVQPSAGVTVRDFAGGLYAVQTLFDPFVDPFGRIPAGWKALHEWVIGSSECRSGEHQWMEEIVAGGNGDDLKLYHPIQMG
jgi:hypothetical protein